jgi:hypothetical protein
MANASEKSMDVDQARAEFLVALLRKYADDNTRILEVGSREGDNLVSLLKAGFTHLSGFEGNVDKVAALKERHPEVAPQVDVTPGPVDSSLRGIAGATFDLVLTVGFLFDKEGDFTWLFPELARVTRRYLISIENESSGTPDDVFERLGLNKVETIDLRTLKELDSVFIARVFEKVSRP